jgi:hypothetical protein
VNLITAVVAIWQTHRAMRIDLAEDNTTIEVWKRGEIVWESEPGDDEYDALLAIITEGAGS